MLLAKLCFRGYFERKFSKFVYFVGENGSMMLELGFFPFKIKIFQLFNSNLVVHQSTTNLTLFRLFQLCQCTWPLSHFSNFIALREDEENVKRINQCNRSRAFEMWNRFVCLSIRAWLVTFDCCHVTGVRLVSICDLSIFCMLFVPFTLALYEKISLFSLLFQSDNSPSCYVMHL